ncbi:hypothetical protein [Thermus sp.]|uniref:hypothetical protein n=1 Tax=Thermus sp. TaxID=275 RepID=UPI0026396CCE|nr:hypothetical protein [Thermus sp.]MCX7849665.1 hypothetical protein [Thermus sp.]
MIFAIEFARTWLLVGVEGGKLRPFGLVPEGKSLEQALIETFGGLPKLSLHRIHEVEVREWLGEAVREIASPALLARVLQDQSLGEGDPLAFLARAVSMDA